jgi:peptidoglycan/LPS O-acetylase OafA/YrhL
VSPHTSDHRPAIRFRTDIQGLRALAVLLVVLYHAGLPFIPGGFVGVDVFFVISGFLITAQLLKGIRENGRVDLVDFYGRRARRILPAALLALVGAVLLTVAFLPRSRWDAIATEAMGSVLFVVNWMFGQGATDYLRQDEAASPVQHFWSLAVEEQFYLLWPLVLMLVLFITQRLVARRTVPGAAAEIRPSAEVIRLRLIVAAAGILFVASLLHSIHLTTANPGMAYFATTTRIYELTVGVFLAIFAGQLARIPRAAALVLGWAGFGAMVLAGLLFSGATWFPGASALVPTLGAAAVIVAGMNGREHSGVGAILSWRPVTWIGDISFSLYLWHWPFIVVATFLFEGLPWYVGLATAALSVLPAWASYRYVERPFQKWRFVKPPWKAIQVGLAGSLVVVIGVVSLDVYSSSQRAEAQAYERPSYARALQRAAGTTPERPLLGAELLERDPDAALSHEPGEAIVPGPEVVMDDLAELYDQGCAVEEGSAEPTTCSYGPDDAGLRVALVGDSHAAHWLPAVNRIAAENSWQVNSYVKRSCPFTSGPIRVRDVEFRTCSTWNENVLEEITQGDYDLVLTSSAGYSSPNGEPVADGYAAAWNSVIDAGIPVGVIMDPRWPVIDSPSECVEVNRDDLAECAYREADSDKTGATFQESALRQADAAVALDLSDQICPEGTCPAVIGNVVVWRDAGHLTATYAETMAPSLLQELRDQDLVPAG